MANKYGIKIGKDVFETATRDKKSVENVLGEVYGEQLDKIRSDVKGAAGFTNVQLALFDSGLNRHSRISAFYSNNGNEYLFPATLEQSIIKATGEQDVLSNVINTTKTSETKDIRTLKLDYTTTENKGKIAYKDVSEGAELPEAKIKESDKTISIYKRGIKIVSTYEAIQDSTLDLLLETIGNAIIENAHTQLGDAVRVLQSGDGNSNPATSLGSTASATAITTAEIIGFLFDYCDAVKKPVDRIVCGKDTAKILASVLYDITKVNGYAAGKMFEFPQLNLENIKVIYDSRVEQVSNKNIFMLYNKAQGVNKFTVANSIINEFDKNIGNQTEIGTLSERCGFGKINDNAIKYVTLG